MSKEGTAYWQRKCQLLWFLPFLYKEHKNVFFYIFLTKNVVNNLKFLAYHTIIVLIVIVIIRKEKSMIFSNAYNYVNVLEKAADASWTRNEVLSNNIANATTPGYKRQDVSFETYLLEELTSGSTTSLRAKVDDVDLSNLNASIYTDYSELSYRLDGNNVDQDTENVELASNQLKYQALIESINYEFNMIKAALNRN